MSHCLHTWAREFHHGQWYGFYRCKRCRARAVCPGCNRVVPRKVTVRYCDQHC